MQQPKFYVIIQKCCIKDAKNAKTSITGTYFFTWYKSISSWLYRDVFVLQDVDKTDPRMFELQKEVKMWQDNYINVNVCWTEANHLESTNSQLKQQVDKLQRSVQVGLRRPINVYRWSTSVYQREQRNERVFLPRNTVIIACVCPQ